MKYDINYFNSKNVFGNELKVNGTTEELLFLSKQNFIQGNILEFGVHKGKTINKIKKYFPKFKIFGFDSFQGLPEDWSLNNKQTIGKGHFSLTNVPVIEGVFIYPGWFEETIDLYLEKYKNDSISFLHVDCDLYSSTKTILTKLNDNIKPGTIIRFDEFTDWASIDNKKYTNKKVKNYLNWQEGEWKAFNEWVQEFDREVISISRNLLYSASIKVIK